MTRVHSFDVFDTLLTRAVASPHDVFLLIGRMKHVAATTGCSPQEFAALRVAAERRMRTGRPEVTLREIYADIASALSLSATAADDLMHTELAVERRLARPVPNARRLLKDADDGLRVGVSDMYLPSNVIWQLLDDHGLAELLDQLFVSSEHLATKGTGALFERVLQATGARPRDCSHVGDHPLSDVRVPRLLGIRARHATTTQLNRYEKAWQRHSAATGGLSSLAAGASRLTRLGIDAAPADRAIVDVAAGVAGPILAAYVLWVLRSASAEGIRRLYFLARDGEILYLIAQRLREKLSLDIDLRYLYGSRSVYHRSALATGDIAEATWAWRAMYRLRAVDVLNRLGLDDDTARTELARLGIDPAAPVTDDLVDRITGDDAVRTTVRHTATGLLERVHAYLRQEGLCDGTAYAIVDTGWAGRIARALEDALPPDATPMRRGYFFGYMSRTDGYHSPEVLRGYLFDEVAGTGFAGEFAQAYGPLETFAVANHGMTVDFIVDDSVEPVLASDTNPALADWPWELYRHTLLEFVDEWVLDADLANTAADLRPAVAEVLEEFWSHPTRDEARAWGAFVYEDDVLSKSRNRLAVGWSATEFARKIVHRGYEGRQLWLNGAVALTSAPLRPAARAGLWVNDCRANGGRSAFLPAAFRRRLPLAAAMWRVRARHRNRP